MATINEVLANNPHREAFNSIIQYLNESGNPFEKALVANLIYNRLSNWGAGKLPLEPPPVLNAPDGYGASVANANLQEEPQVGAYMIRQAAISANAGDPLVSQIVSFRNYLDGISANVANAWVDFNLAVDVFYEIIDPFTYFAASYKAGAEKSTFLDILGLYERPGVAGNGILVQTVQDGISGTAPRAATTTLIVDQVVVGDLPIYFTHFTNATTRYIIWATVDGSGSAPTLDPIAGVTDIAVEITLTSGMSQQEVRNAFSSGFEGNLQDVVVGLDPGGTSFSISNTFAGVVPESTFNVPATGSWDELFSQGSNLTEGTPELLQISYGAVIASELGGRYFQLFFGASRFAVNYVFWYNVDGSNVQPVVPGATGYFEIAISSTDSLSDVQAATDPVVEGAQFGAWTKVNQVDCCSLFAVNGDQPAPDNGTVAVYSGAIETMRSAGDDSVIDTVNEADSKQWATTNNTLRAVYDSAFEQDFYLVSLSEAPTFNLVKTGALQNVYRFFPFNIETATLAYNTPGTQWNNRLVAKTRNKSI